MGLVRTALIFGAGYVLGRPEGRQQIAQLARRPEVTQLRQQAVDTVSAKVETGRQRLTKSADSSDTPDGPRGRRLPSFPRRGTRPAAYSATTPATDPLAAGPVSTDAVSGDAVSTDVLSSDALFTDATSTDTSTTGTSTTGKGSTGTGSTGTPPVPPTPRQR